MGRRGNRTEHRWLALAVLVMATVGLAVPSPVAAAESDVATTTTVTATLPSGYRDPDRQLRATVSTGTSVPPTGIVVFAIDGAEVGRAVLRVGSTSSLAVLLLEVPVGADRQVTAAYLGTPGFGSSSGSTLVSVSPLTPVAPGSGQWRFGGSIVPIEPGDPFLIAKPATDPITGIGSASFARTGHTITEDLPGTGPVTAAFNLRGTLSIDVGSDGSVRGAVQLRPDVRTVTVDGTTWDAGCLTFGGDGGGALAGSVEGTTLRIDTVFDASVPTGSSDCGGFGDIVNAVLARPVELVVEVEGTFPLPPPEGTPTTTAVSVDGTGWDTTSPLKIFSRVDSSYGQVKLGNVTIHVNGTAVATYGAAATGGYTYLGPLVPGPNEITASFAGSSPFAASSATITIDVDPPPDGTAVDGAITLGTNVAPLPPGSKLVGADLDPATGAFTATALWTPRGSVPVDTGIVGIVDLVYRARSTSPISGQVAPDGTVAFDPVDLRFEILGYSQDLDTQPVSALTDCYLDPMTVTLTGTASVDGLDLGDQAVARPPLPPSGCSGLASFISGRLGTTFDIDLSVAGDFRVGVEETDLTVSSWLPTIDQDNQTLLVVSATAATTPGGTIAFYDGDTLVGEATLDPAGQALAPVTLASPGTRTIEARYLGDATHRRATATTTVEVIAAPEGLALDGTLSIGTTDLPIGEGSILEPQGAAAPAADPAGAMAAAIEQPGARLWFAPTTAQLDVPGYGPMTTELRLVQNGRMNATDIGPDGSFANLFGAFALQIRAVTTADGTTVRPIGCANIVLLVLDGQLRITDALLDTAGGGSAGYRNAACTGVGRAVATTLANRTVDLQATVDY